MEFVIETKCLLTADSADLYSGPMIYIQDITALRPLLGASQTGDHTG